MRTLARIALTLICCLPLVNCSDDSCICPCGQDLPQPDIVVKDLEADISIGYGQTVLVEEENLYITFIHVTEGRCPFEVDCFWEGQAATAFRIDLPGRGPSTVTPIIRPSSEPGKTPDMTDYTWGYSFTLLRLDPYPDLEHDYDPEDYSAILMIGKVSNGVRIDRVIPTSSPPGLLQRDPVVVREGTITGNVLTLTVSRGGGCGDHAYKLYWSPAFMESYPVQTNLFLQHVNLGDFCEAFITTQGSFDIREIAERYAAGYGGFDDIILNVYGYFEDEPGDRISVTYSPE